MKGVKNKKRILALILTGMLLLCNGTSYADDCIHVWLEAAGVPQIRIEMHDDVSHKHVTYVSYSCVRCGQIEWRPSEYVAPVYEPHSMGYVKDLGHAGHTIHNYLYRCVKCGREEIVSELCFGPPCTTHIEKVPDTQKDSDE